MFPNGTIKTVFCVHEVLRLRMYNYYLSWNPNSVRWLLVHGRYEEGKQILRQMAKRNKMKEPDLVMLEAVVEKEQEEQARNKNYTYLELLKHKDLQLKTFIFGFAWYVVSVNFVWFMYKLTTLSLHYRSSNDFRITYGNYH